MVRAVTLLVAVALLGCQKDPPPPPATGRQAPRGLPPADPADVAKAAAPQQPAEPALPRNHPPMPGQPGTPHPPINEPPPGHGETAPHGADVPDGSPELAGEIAASAALAAEVKPGDTIYVFARSVKPDGSVERTSLAATRLEVRALPLVFRLNANNVMAAGAAFAGEVELTARVDRDGEVMSRAPGDIEGKVRAKIPASDVKIVLDTKVAP
jgi:hypothetical protein